MRTFDVLNSADRFLLEIYAINVAVRYRGRVKNPQALENRRQSMRMADDKYSVARIMITQFLDLLRGLVALDCVRFDIEMLGQKTRSLLSSRQLSGVYMRQSC